MLHQTISLLVRLSLPQDELYWSRLGQFMHPVIIFNFIVFATADSERFTHNFNEPSLGKSNADLLKKKKKKKKKTREKSRERHNHKPQPLLDTKRKRKSTNPNKHKSNKRTKSSKTSSTITCNGVLLIYTLEGASSVANFITAY